MLNTYIKHENLKIPLYKESSRWLYSKPSNIVIPRFLLLKIFIIYFCRTLLEDPSLNAPTSAKLFQLHHVKFKLDSKGAPAYDGRDILEGQQVSYLSCPFPHGSQNDLNTENQITLFSC